MGSEMHAMEDGKPTNGIDGVKFTKNGGTDGDCVNMAQPTTKLIGLTKEQLEQYRNDPFWKTIRYTLFILFWLVWAAMFFGAILIVVLSPKCAAKVEPKWHENAVSYQIFTPAFRDSDNDGVGDLKGIEQKLDSLRKVGINAIWPTPIVKTNKDVWAPEEVVDVLSVDPRLGSEDDLQSLIDSAHKAGIKFITDLPLTAASANGTVLLDVEKEAVQNKLIDAAKKWLHMGVDGIHLADYGLAKKSAAKKPTSLVQRLRRVISEDDAIIHKEVLIFSSEGVDPSEMAADGENYYAQSLIEPVDAGVALLSRVKENIQKGLSVIHGNNTIRPIWQLGSLVNGPRLDQLLRDDLKAKSTETSALLTLIELFLPGPVNVLYGDELALPSAQLSSDIKDPNQRSIAAGRVIQPWEPGKNTGFSSINAKLFFPAASNASKIQTFSEQFADANSPLKAFERLAELRVRDVVFQQGECRLQSSTNGVHLYTRVVPGSPSEPVYVLAVNWSDKRKEWALPKGDEAAALFGGKAPSGKAQVKVPSAFNTAQKMNQELDISSTPLALDPYTAVVLKMH